MSARSRKTRLLSVALLFAAGAALAAPPADMKLVDLWSRMDEFHAARGVRKADAPRELKRVAAPDEGLASSIDAFLDGHPNTGLLVLKDDVILAERYQYGRTPSHRFASQSVAKTVLGMLVGIALAEKAIASIDDRADRYLPELKGHPYGETTIRNLLTMSSGMAFRENWNNRGERNEAVGLVNATLHRGTEGGADAVLQFRRRDVAQGTRFNYSSADSEVLGLVLRAAVKMPLATYLSEKIWQPMGAEANATWLLDKGGYETAYCCLNATLRDYARFGRLLANYGVLDGREIIPTEWVKAATRAEQRHLHVGFATTNNGYGYQTWLISRDHPRFAALGIGGQAIFVDPQQKLVVVHTAAWADPGDRAERGAQFRLWQHLLEKLSS